MADEELLKLLQRDLKAWNNWRKENPYEHPFFGGASLGMANLAGADLSNTYLKGANLVRADLSNANLSGANLSETDLFRANLHGANLTSANLKRANSAMAILTGADLSQSDLTELALHSAKVKKANFSGARFNNSIISYVDLSEASGLEASVHVGPSSVTTSTLLLSKGIVPEVFLRGCGLTDWEIEATKLHNPNLTNEEINDIQYRIFDLRAEQPFQFSSLFISYSHADTSFVDFLGEHFERKGIRYWRDIHHSTSGRLERVVDRAIRLNPTVLLVLSRDSVNSDWVEHEVTKARKLEKELGRDVLCPVTLDDAWKSSASWSAVLMDQVKKYNILDFSKWQDQDEFKGKFTRLLDGLNLFYAKPTKR